MIVESLLPQLLLLSIFLFLLQLMSSYRSYIQDTDTVISLPTTSSSLVHEIGSSEKKNDDEVWSLIGCETCFSFSYAYALCTIMYRISL